ncbi:Protein SHQ1 -like protein [Halotydeus destructor]|nr:Protein SHQ1 -like protein [Halotydeus destructor]
MLTPSFKLSQDDNYVYIEIKAPHARLADSEIDFYDEDFKFFAHPYYLRLHLPKQVVENGNEYAKWDVDTFMFNIRLPKKVPGEHFEGLDMLTQLLTVPESKKAKAIPKIEVIDGEDEEQDEEDDYDWHVEQKVWNEEDERKLSGQNYGFANKYSGVFSRLGDESYLLVDVQEPDSKSPLERKKERQAAELLLFDEDHYLADMHEQCEVMDSILECNPFSISNIMSEHFSTEEEFRMKNLPRKSFLLEKSEQRKLLLGMIDILFGYCYDLRANEGEHNVESAWTLCKLSSTLSWLDCFDSIQEVLISSVRRSLCFPLYRNWQLSNRVVNDVVHVLKSGKRCIIKCFLDIHQLMNESGDSRYILNDLYITDYCVWLQKVNESTFSALAAAIEETNILKNDLELDLELLEKAALLVIQEEQMSTEVSSKNIVNDFQNITIT